MGRDMVPKGGFDRSVRASLRFAPRPASQAFRRRPWRLILLFVGGLLGFKSPRNHHSK